MATQTAPGLDQAVIDRLKQQIEDVLQNYGAQGAAGQIVAILKPHVKKRPGRPKKTVNQYAGQGARGWNDPDLDLRPSEEERKATRKLMSRGNGLGIAGDVLARMSGSVAEAKRGMTASPMMYRNVLGTNMENAMRAGTTIEDMAEAGFKSAGSKLERFYKDLAEQYLAQDRLARSIAMSRNERELPASLWNSAYRNQPKVGD